MENYTYNSSYPESGGSSPRSRDIEFENPPPWEDSQSQPSNYRVKFMCSYGGKIHPRPHDNQLAYVGGETKILSVDRNIKFVPLLSKLIALCDGDNSISFKYQLPGEDLDALISVTNDDDLEHMMHEYDRLYKVSPRPTRLRIFMFPSLSQNPSLNSSARSFGSEEGKSEKARFVDALNCAPIVATPPDLASAVAPPQPPPPASNVDFFFDMGKENSAVPQPPLQQPMRVQEVEDPVIVPPGLDDRFVGLDPIQKHIQDLQKLRLEEQQGITYRQKSDDNPAGGDYYKMQENPSQIAVPGGVPYWTEKQAHGGVYPGSTVNEQPVYMMQAPASAYHAPMMRQVTGAPTQGYYTVQRIPSDVYRDQQQMYNMMPPSAVQSMASAPSSMPPQNVAGYSDGYGMLRQSTAGGMGMVTESGYAQMAYDGGMGRQVIYTTPGGVMGNQAQVQAAAAAQYQAAMAAAGQGGGALNPETGGKVVAKATQA
ncbi:hypothetical protein ACJIZ3_015625 [Penstemon smallii]|uniref:PB1 domain-containing protein n=1 Tax=Penstemon smallii TaxID=265156 RepID=A0ABD3RQB8_9LAMI